MPKTIQGALYYGAAETDIPLLAGQVIWLVQWICTHRIIYSPGQLVDALNGWTKYVTPANMMEVQAIIYQANPLLETEMATRALLP